MLSPPAVACGSNGGGRHWARFTSNSLSQLAKCTWARGLLTELRANPERRSKVAQQSDVAWKAERRAQAISILRTLPRFPNLECLRLILTFGDEADASLVDLIRSTFRALPRLFRLKLSFDLGPFHTPAAGSDAASQHAGLKSLMQCIDELRSLRELTIDGYSNVDMGDVSFERLLHCPGLRRLEWAVAPYTADPLADLPLRLSQISQIAQCTQIESLSCKAWHVAGPNAALALRRFVEVRRSAEASASSQDQPLLPVRTLTDLDLRRTDLQIESMLSLLAQFSGLTDISPRSWTTDRHRASFDELSLHWANLGAFKQLRFLRLDGGRTAAVQTSLEAILTQLSQCGTIQQLTLISLKLSEAQLQAIVRHHKALHTLVLDCVSLDSLDALSDASALTSLSLRHCVPPPLPRVTMRSLVPRLPELSRLTILDTDHLRVTAAKAAPLNDSLMQRCPKLVRAKFEENLKWA